MVDDANHALPQGPYGIFLILGNAGFISSTVGLRICIGVRDSQVLGQLG